MSEKKSEERGKVKSGEQASALRSNRSPLSFCGLAIALRSNRSPLSFCGSAIALRSNRSPLSFCAPHWNNIEPINADCEAHV